MKTDTRDSDHTLLREIILMLRITDNTLNYQLLVANIIKRSKVIKTS